MFLCSPCCYCVPVQRHGLDIPRQVSWLKKKLSLDAWQIPCTDYIPAGDINSDGSVDLTDAILTLKVLTGSCSESEIDRITLLGDINNDGNSSMAEVIHIIRTIASL